MKTVAVVDYGMSNLRSVSRALEHVAGENWRVVISAEADSVRRADKVVFPGQGAIGNCMSLLRDTGLDAAIRETVQGHSKPFLGICLGLQTLLETSEESGGTAGFGFIPGSVRRFADDLRDPRDGQHLKIPHMGWNQVNPTHDHPLWAGITPGSRFYFVHSYYAAPADPALCAATTPYPSDFTSAVAYDNLFAVQFHPEKSQHDGLRLLENFLAW